MSNGCGCLVVLCSFLISMFGIKIFFFLIFVGSLFNGGLKYESLIKSHKANQKTDHNNEKAKQTGKNSITF